MTPGLFRFLLAPGEAWFRLVALLCGASVNVGDNAEIGIERETQEQFTIALSPDRAAMRIAIGRMSAVVGKSDAEQIAEAIGAGAQQMTTPGDTP